MRRLSLDRSRGRGGAGTHPDNEEGALDLFEGEDGRDNEDSSDWTREGLSPLGKLSVLRYVIFPDALTRRRIKFPAVYGPEGPRKSSSEWWDQVKGHFNMPVGALRPIPILPECILRQVADELEEAGHRLETSFPPVENNRYRVSNANLQRSRAVA